MSESARAATADDLDQLAAIVIAHAENILEDRGAAMLLQEELIVGPIDEQLARALDDPTRLVVAGTFDDVILGVAHASRQQLPNGDQIARLEHFVVDGAAREVGIGEAMMDQILEWARGGGCVGIDSRALPGDRHTKNFFESFGLKARLLVVHRRLDR